MKFGGRGPTVRDAGITASTVPVVFGARFHKSPVIIVRHLPLVLHHDADRSV